MLKNHPQRAVAIFAVEFEPIVDFAKVTSAAEVLHKRMKTPHWAVTTGSYAFRDMTHRHLAVVDFRRVSVQMLGLETWQKELADFASQVTLILQKLGISRLKRIGFLTRTFLSLGMSHREMADLMFGSYLALAQDFQEICGKPDDVLVQLHGEEGNMKLQLVVAPMTEDQAGKSFLSTENLEAFVEPKLIDTGVKDFKDRIATDCFFVQVDLFRTDVADSEVPLFLRQSFDGADRITEAAVQKLKSLRIRRGR
jgi:hypothetical protein